MRHLGNSLAQVAKSASPIYLASVAKLNPQIGCYVNTRNLKRTLKKCNEDFIDERTLTMLWKLSNLGGLTNEASPLIIRLLGTL